MTQLPKNNYDGKQNSPAVTNPTAQVNTQPKHIHILNIFLLKLYIPTKIIINKIQFIINILTVSYMLNLMISCN